MAGGPTIPYQPHPPTLYIPEILKPLPVPSSCPPTEDSCFPDTPLSLSRAPLLLLSPPSPKTIPQHLSSTATHSLRPMTFIMCMPRAGKVTAENHSTPTPGQTRSPHPILAPPILPMGPCLPPTASPSPASFFLPISNLGSSLWKPAYFLPPKVCLLPPQHPPPPQVYFSP